MMGLYRVPKLNLLSKNKKYKIIGDKQKDTKITVITPVYNAKKHLKRTIDSVIHQSIGFENIEYILIDDCSTDGSREILLEYSSLYENIIVAFLQCNTGTPGYPRNIGIQLSSSPYITFLDADDWFEPHGLEALYNILEETGDDYVVGKTIQVEANGTKIVGEHESCKERRNVSPFTIPHIFQHLGPRARMMRTELVKNHEIKFPEMKFAEDKQFFIDVLVHCQTISTTKAPIYYLNRINHQDRLSNQTNILQKTKCNLKVIQYVIQKNIDFEKQQMILNRLYEFDSITRFFSTPHFQKTRLKQIYYYTFNKVLKTTKRLGYDVSDYFFDPYNKVVFDLYQNKKFKDLAALFQWNKKEKVKEVIIKENLPYIVAPILEDSYKHIRVPMYAVFQQNYIQNDTYFVYFKVYGDHLHSLTDAVIRHAKDACIEYKLDVKVDESGDGLLKINLELLKDLPPSSYSIFLRYNDYLKINIRKLTKSRIDYYLHHRDYVFYNTVYSNVGLKIIG